MTAIPERPALPARICLVALWLLLAGYLIVNKPFASLGFAPLYVGELVFAGALAVGLLNWRQTFLEPLKQSLGLKILAALWVYAVARAVWDVQHHGILALRDGAMIGYGLLAFTALGLWRRIAGDDPRAVLSHVSGWLLPIALVASLVSAGVRFGWFSQAFNLSVKIDFVTLAAAVGAWVSFIAALKWIAVGGHYSQARKRDGVYRWILVAFYFGFSLWAWSVVFRMPTRAVLVSAAPLAVFFVGAWLTALWQRAIWIAALLICCGIAASQLSPRLNAFAAYNDRFGLKQNVDLPLAELERRTLRAMTGDLSGVPEDIRARFVPLLPPDDPSVVEKGFSFSEHSLRWRVVFWQRCWHYTLARAPLTGNGFGGNLTALMLPTRAWPDYVPSQRMTPPNRSPHGFHAHIFARLGFIGLALWVSLLAAIVFAALKALWFWRAQTDRRGREAFYDTLALFGFWIVLLTAGSFGVIVEGPFGGMWFWSLSGVLLWTGSNLPSRPVTAPAE